LRLDLKVKGFGKNYFSLSAVQAYSSSVTMHSQITSYTFLTPKNINEYDDSFEEDPPDILELPDILNQNKKPCHCNEFFTHLSKLMVLLNHYIPRCPYYTTYFAFRRTGVHPPLYFI
jgi:hypothetical protein